jgi:hypothetical protein
MTCLQRNKSAAEENIVLQRIVSREITVSEYICFLTALKQVQRKALEEWNTRSLLLCLYYSVYYSVFTTLSLLLCLYYSVFTTLSLLLCLYYSVITTGAAKGPGGVEYSVGKHAQGRQRQVWFSLV